ncbi:MAG: hypothetical protein WDO13_00690 [Verrucomicrobiota bacterium]
MRSTPPERRGLERQFNILLASRLSAEPEGIVLERWRLNDAVFEKSLEAQRVAPFWTGSTLIDGSLQERDGVIVARLRLRSPKSAEVTLSDQDTPENLSDLVGRLADKIRQRPVGAVAWKPGRRSGPLCRAGKMVPGQQAFRRGRGGD